MSDENVLTGVTDPPTDSYTLDMILGGQLHLAQPEKGFRFGTDSILAAAAVPVKPGNSILDMGCGVGVIAACVGVRCPETDITAVDVSDNMVQFARWNVIAQNLTDRISVIRGNIASALPNIADGTFDHVVFNPPYFECDQHQSAHGDGRKLARQGGGIPLALWFKAARRYVRPGGSITLVLRASRMAEILKHISIGAGSIEVFPFLPKSGNRAKTIIVRAFKGSNGPLVLNAGVVLHNDDGSPTREADRLLRDGHSLDDIIAAIAASQN